MTSNALDPESEILYQIIRGEFQGNTPVSLSDDAEFAASLRKTAQNIKANPLYQADLEMRLKRIKPASAKPGNVFYSGIVKNLAWVAAAMVAIFIISWAIRTLLPQPPIAATAPVDLTVTETPTLTPSPPSEADVQISEGESTPIADAYTSPLFPDDALLVKADFPESPTEAMVYQQLFDDSLTIEKARAMAQQLGVNGNVYLASNEAQQIVNYYVSDGVSRVLFYSPYHFYYVADYAKIQKVEKQIGPTSDEQIAIAETFLKDHGLYNSYRIETDDSIPGTIYFEQLLNDSPISYGSMYSPDITVQISPQGEIKSIYYNVLFFTDSGLYPIISAQEAWQKALASDLPQGVEANSHTVNPPINETWLREYPQGETVELFGYLEILQPAEVNTSPLVFLNNYPLQGNLDQLIQSASTNQFMQVWGQFQPDSNGHLFFQVEGWQPSFFADQVLEGDIERLDDQDYLITDDMDWLIPDLPADIPDGFHGFVRGVVLDSEGTLDWSTINTVMGGGGGGGGGGSGFAELNLEQLPVPTSQPTSTPYPLPQVGERFEGVQGNPYVTFFKEDDGSTRLFAYVNLKPSEKWPGGLSINLTGDGLEGIEAYHQLPIKFWGSITDFKDAMPIVTVERYEPVYPGIKAQAWLGTLNLVTLGDRPVLQFTDQTGTTYILNSSLESEAKVPQADIPFVVEGAIYPDQTFAGFPVINDFLMFGAQGLDNLDDYELQSGSPSVIDSPYTQNKAQILTIEKIELAYYTNDLRYSLPGDFVSPVYAQPVWRFTGHYEDGREFEILVQALSEEYLQ